jgi:ribosome assembly protein SQT1
MDDDAGGMDEDVVDQSAACFAGHTDSVYAVAISPVDDGIAASGGGDDVAYLWRTADGQILHRLAAHTDSVVCTAFSRDGKYLATGGMDGQVLVWDVATGAQVVACEGCSEVEWVDWHPRGHVLLGGSSDGNVWMWKVPSGHMMAVFAAHTDPVRAGMFTPDGKGLVSVAEDGVLIVWDPKTSEPAVKVGAGTRDWHECPVSAVSVSADGTLVASGGEDGTARVVAVGSGKVVAALAAHDASVEAVRFSPAHAYLATAALDGKLCVWETNQAFRLRHTLVCDGGIVAVEWHPTQPIVFTASLDRRVRAWDVRTGECVQTWTGHTHDILGLAVSPTGAMVVTCADDHTARVFAFAH